MNTSATSWKTLVVIACLCIPTRAHGQVPITTLSEAIRAAEAANRTIQAAAIERQKAEREVAVAKTHRLPLLSVTAFGSQPLTQLGVTLERGSLGVYAHDGPIPGETTTLTSPLRVGLIGYASVAQPLTQQHKIGLGIQLAALAVDASSEELRAKRHAVINDVRHLYYGIVQAESGRTTLQATVDFLKQLERETDQQVAQRIALRADELQVKAQLVQAEYELLKMDDPIAAQKEQLNRLMGRAIDAPLEIDAASIVAGDVVPLSDAIAEALASRPEIRLAKLHQRKAHLERRLASAKRIPDVSLSLQSLRTVHYSSVFPNNVTSVGVQGTWDVFDWGKKRQEIHQKEETEAQTALDVKDTEARIMADVAHQYRRIAEMRKHVEVAQVLQASGTEAVRVARNRYLQRESVMSEVDKVESMLADANHRYTQAVMDLATALADFETAMGRDR